eukprot:1354281-Prymnesium_polylepis.1
MVHPFNAEAVLARASRKRRGPTGIHYLGATIVLLLCWRPAKQGLQVVQKKSALKQLTLIERSAELSAAARNREELAAAARNEQGHTASSAAAEGGVARLLPDYARDDPLRPRDVKRQTTASPLVQSSEERSP